MYSIYSIYIYTVIPLKTIPTDKSFRQSPLEPWLRPSHLIYYFIPFGTGFFLMQSTKWKNKTPFEPCWDHQISSCLKPVFPILIFWHYFLHLRPVSAKDHFGYGCLISRFVTRFATMRTSLFNHVGRRPGLRQVNCVCAPKMFEHKLPKLVITFLTGTSST